jgi:uncharacterized protein
MDDTALLAALEAADTETPPTDSVRSESVDPERLEDCLFTTMAATRATGFVIESGQCPVLEIGDSRVQVGSSALTGDGFDRLTRELLPPKALERLAATGATEHQRRHYVDGIGVELFTLRAARSADRFSVTVARMTDSVAGGRAEIAVLETAEAPGEAPAGLDGRPVPGQDNDGWWRREMSNLKSVIGNLVQVEGVTTAAVVARDGFLIEGVSTDGRLDAEAVGAVISTGIGSSEVMGGELGAGEMVQALIEYRNGSVLIVPLANEAILAVLASHGTNIGNVRFQLKRRLPEIEKEIG